MVAMEECKGNSLMYTTSLYNFIHDARPTKVVFLKPLLRISGFISAVCQHFLFCIMYEHGDQIVFCS